MLAANDKEKRSGDGLAKNLQRRTFRTRRATVSIQFRKPDINGHDIIEALREVKRRVVKDGVV